ncbi:MAG: dTDP-4-dehydrorhamnose 3,5-epimerase family protein, partial [Bacteroidota bacterium]|nr:dTDP-4-dehydrorhamnose 3,5-epimerase family protein [Bacteroidota bacterium]
MKIVETPIENLFILESKVFEDSRGYFFEAFNKSQLEKKNISYNFVQDNQSKSKYGVIRALHYQLAPHSQAKLVRVIKGKVLDVV